MFDIESLNHLVGLGTIAIQIAAVALFAVYFGRKRFPTFQDIGVSTARWGLRAALLLTLAAIAAALFYSDVLGFEPCPLCWWQRVFLFPQAILFALALWKGEGSRIAYYSIALSIAGFGIALYQHALQMFPGSLPCPATGVSCAQRLLFEYGYVTFPLVAASVFALLIVLMLFVRNGNRA